MHQQFFQLRCFSVHCIQSQIFLALYIYYYQSAVHYRIFFCSLSLVISGGFSSSIFTILIISFSHLQRKYEVSTIRVNQYLFKVGCTFLDRQYYTTIFTNWLIRRRVRVMMRTIHSSHVGRLYAPRMPLRKDFVMPNCHFFPGSCVIVYFSVLYNNKAMFFNCFIFSSNSVFQRASCYSCCLCIKISSSQKQVYRYQITENKLLNSCDRKIKVQVHFIKT